MPKYKTIHFTSKKAIIMGKMFLQKSEQQQNQQPVPNKTNKPVQLHLSEAPPIPTLDQSIDFTGGKDRPTNLPSFSSTVQRIGIDEEDLLMGKFKEPIQQKTESVNGLSAVNSPDNYRDQAVSRKENNTGLPDNLKTGIENLSGYSMDDVKVHYNSSKPAQLQAHAYAQGTDIHIAPGQEKHLPHEAWHVVQQKQGRVKPTMQLKGVNVNDDVGLEREADMMGGKALQLSQKQIKNYSTNKNANKFAPFISNNNPVQMKLWIKWRDKGNVESREMHNKNDFEWNTGGKIGEAFINRIIVNSIDYLPTKLASNLVADYSLEKKAKEDTIKHIENYKIDPKPILETVSEEKSDSLIDDSDVNTEWEKLEDELGMYDESKSPESFVDLILNLPYYVKNYLEYTLKESELTKIDSKLTNYNIPEGESVKNIDEIFNMVRNIVLNLDLEFENEDKKEEGKQLFEAKIPPLIEEINKNIYLWTDELFLDENLKVKEAENMEEINGKSIKDILIKVEELNTKQEKKSYQLLIKLLAEELLEQDNTMRLSVPTTINTFGGSPFNLKNSLSFELTQSHSEVKFTLSDCYFVHNINNTYPPNYGAEFTPTPNLAGLGTDTDEYKRLKRIDDELKKKPLKIHTHYAPKNPRMPITVSIKYGFNDFKNPASVFSKAEDVSKNFSEIKGKHGSKLEWQTWFKDNKDTKNLAKNAKKKGWVETPSGGFPSWIDEPYDKD